MPGAPVLEEHHQQFGDPLLLVKDHHLQLQIEMYLMCNSQVKKNS